MRAFAATIAFLVAVVVIAMPHADAASADQRQAMVVRASPDLLGDWRADGNGISRVVVSPGGPGWVRLSAYGACSPTPCKWGGVQGRLYAENAGSLSGTAATATYDFGFDRVILTAHLSRKREPPLLRVETYTHFTDGSSRSDYWDLVYLHKS